MQDKLPETYDHGDLHSIWAQFIYLLLYFFELILPNFILIGLFCYQDSLLPDLQHNAILYIALHFSVQIVGRLWTPFCDSVFDFLHRLDNLDAIELEALIPYF